MFSKNESLVATGTGAACFNRPLLSVYWLACRMSANGEPIRVGEVILTGALGPMIVLEAGDRVEVTIEGLGSVRCRAG